MCCILVLSTGPGVFHELYKCQWWVNAVWMDGLHWRYLLCTKKSERKSILPFKKSWQNCIIQKKIKWYNVTQGLGREYLDSNAGFVCSWTIYQLMSLQGSLKFSQQLSWNTDNITYCTWFLWWSSKMTILKHIMGFPQRRLLKPIFSV